MSAPRSRIADWVNNSDPYGHSPFDSHAKYQDPRARSTRGSPDTDDSDSDYHRRRSHSSPKSRRSSRTSYRDHDDHDRKAGHGRHHSPRHEGRSRSQRPSDMTDGPHRGQEESDWDTDYDPRDKYYLSGDEGADRAPPRKYSREQYKPRDDEHRRSTHHHDSDRGSHHGRQPARHSLPRRESSDSTARRHPASRSARPKAMSRHSSYNGRPRSARYPPNSSKTRYISKGIKTGLGDGEEAGEKDNAWETAVRSGMKAATIAALRVSGQKGSIYEKVPRVATAAVTAAVVDSFLTARHPGAKGGTRHAVMRQVAELAIGNLVAKPAAKGVKARRHPS